MVEQLDLNNDESGEVRTQVGPWGMVPAWVLKYLKGAEVSVYVSLRTFADRTGHGFPHTKTISERAGVAVSTTRNSIQKMRQLGLVHTTERRRADGSLAGLDYLLVDVEPNSTGVPPGSDLTLPAETSSQSLDEVTGVPPGSDAVTHQINTPIPPPPTSSTNGSVDNPVEAQTGEEEVLKLKNNYYPDDLKVFVKNLNYGEVKPSQADYKRVAHALKRLWGKVPDSELKKQLELNTGSARCLPAVYEARLNSWTVDDLKPKTKSASTEKPHTMSPPKFESAPGVAMPDDVKAAFERILGPRKHWGSKRQEASTTGPQKVRETLEVLRVPATV